MTGLLRHASHPSWGIVDIVRRFAVSVFAGGVERLAGEDLAGLRVGGDGPAVVDERFGHASRVALAGVEDPAFAGDVVPRDAAAPRRGRAGIRRAVRWARRSRMPGDGRGPLPRGAVAAFDPALRPGRRGRPSLWRTPIGAGVRPERPGVAPIGPAAYTAPSSAGVPAGMPCSAHARGNAASEGV